LTDDAILRGGSNANDVFIWSYNVLKVDYNEQDDEDESDYEMVTLESTLRKCSVLEGRMLVDNTIAEGCGTKVIGGQSSEEERRAKLRSGASNGQVSASGCEDNYPGPVAGPLAACEQPNRLITLFGKATQREKPTDRSGQSKEVEGPTDDSGKPIAEGKQTSFPKGVCKDFLNKVCKRGINCKFSHVGARKSASRLRPVYKNFLNGKCKLSIWQCKFRHISEAENEREKAADRVQSGSH